MTNKQQKQFEEHKAHLKSTQGKRTDLEQRNWEHFKERLTSKFYGPRRLWL